MPLTSRVDSLPKLWRVTIRAYKSWPFHWYIVTHETQEKNVAKLAKTRFSEAWWDDHTITEITELGEVHIINNTIFEQEINY